MSKDDIFKEKWRPIVLIILDGWGVAPAGEGNALSLAKLPFFNELVDKYPCLTLKAAGPAVGLPEGAAGASEAGHLTLGAGRPVWQDLALINQAIADKSFFKLPAWQAVWQRLKKHNSSLHLIGLLSAGQVHSSLNHLAALLELAKRKKLAKVYVHAILDGHDTPRVSGLDYVAKLEVLLARLGVGQIASLCGRFYAMDRDRHWARTEAAYRLLAAGAGERSGEAAKAIQKSYDQKIYDAEFKPTVIVDKTNQPKAIIKPGDGVVFFNWRSDGVRQLARALVEPQFNEFKRKRINNLELVTMTEYESGLPATAAFAKTEIKDGLGEVIAKAGLKQLRLAESEKYAPVTAFFNGGREAAWTNEDRLLIPSPPTVNYAKQPAMSAEAIAAAAGVKIDSQAYDFIVVNFANVDMVGHTGDVAATSQAAEAIDDCLKVLVKKIINSGGLAVLTADHGQAEAMVNWQLGEAAKGHSANPVPFIIVGSRLEGYNLGMGNAAVGDLSLLQPSGTLADVAPTILKLLGLAIPPAMTGTSLL
jgi:2,3-bisphosphoglycerate-independent phosphoglycerate mutase